MTTHAWETPARGRPQPRTASTNGGAPSATGLPHWETPKTHPTAPAAPIADGAAIRKRNTTESRYINLETSVNTHRKRTRNAVSVAPCSARPGEPPSSRSHHRSEQPQIQTLESRVITRNERKEQCSAEMRRAVQCCTMQTYERETPNTQSPSARSYHRTEQPRIPTPVRTKRADQCCAVQ